MNDATNADTQTAGTAAPDTGATDPTLLTKPQDQAGAQAPAQDGKTEGDTGQTEPKDAKPEGAPEKYEFQVPDGMQADTKAMGEFEPLARELNLTTAQAQKLVDVYAKQVQARGEAYVAQQAEWVGAVKSDKEIGGAALDTSIRQAQTAIQKFGTPALAQALESTGMGNHPEMVRLMARIGKAMGEDTFIQSGQASGGKHDPAKTLFPSMS